MKVLLTMILSLWVSISLGQNKVSQYLDSLGKVYADPDLKKVKVGRLSDYAVINLLEFKVSGQHHPIDTLRIIHIYDNYSYTNPVHLIVCIGKVRQDTLISALLPMNNKTIQWYYDAKHLGTANAQQWLSLQTTVRNNTQNQPIFTFSRKQRKANYPVPNLPYTVRYMKHYRLNRHYKVYVYAVQQGNNQILFHLAPKIGFIGYDCWEGDRRTVQYQLTKINQVFIKDFIRQDRCITSFCEIDRFK